MFGSAKKNTGLVNNDIETIIGRNTHFKGILSGEGNIRIDGKLEGEIAGDGDVVVGEQGEVYAEIKARNVLISGNVKGNINVSAKLEIMNSGRLCGDVRAAILSIAEGALFKGNSNMEPAKFVDLQENEPGKDK